MLPSFVKRDQDKKLLEISRISSALATVLSCRDPGRENTTNNHSRHCYSPPKAPTAQNTAPVLSQYYGDVIYQTPAKLCEFSHNEILTRSMEKLESVQYSAALAVTGTSRGTSRANLYAELGWESLNLRRWSRRLTLLYKIVNNLSQCLFSTWQKVSIRKIRKSVFLS